MQRALKPWLSPFGGESVISTRGTHCTISQMKQDFEVACGQARGYPQIRCIGLWITLRAQRQVIGL
jgi:hypothetical protein